jgi:hypothetical protein
LSQGTQRGLRVDRARGVGDLTRPKAKGASAPFGMRVTEDDSTSPGRKLRGQQLSVYPSPEHDNQIASPR